MTKWIEATGKNEEAAIAAALAQLGLDRDDVSVQVIERAKSGFLGIGAAPARVRVSYEAPEEVEKILKETAAPKKESPKKPPVVEKKQEKPAPKVETPKVEEKKPQPVKEAPVKVSTQETPVVETAAPSEEVEIGRASCRERVYVLV